MISLTNPLNLLPPQYSTTVKIGAYALAAIILFMAGWTINGWRKEVQYQSLISKQAEAQAAQLKEVIKERDIIQQQISLVDRKLAEERSNAQTKINDLRNRLANGSMRLSIPTTNCVRKANNTSGCNGTERSELDRATSESIIAIGEYGDESIQQLTACQNILKAQQF